MKSSLETKKKEVTINIFVAEAYKNKDVNSLGIASLILGL